MVDGVALLGCIDMITRLGPIGHDAVVVTMRARSCTELQINIEPDMDGKSVVPGIVQYIAISAQRTVGSGIGRRPG